MSRSDRRGLGTVLAVFGLAAAVLCGAGAAMTWWSIGDLRDADRLSASGRDTTAVVIEHDRTLAQPPITASEYYWIDYRFAVDDRSYQHQALVRPDRWATLPLGSTVPVRYLPDDPDVTMLRDGEVLSPAWLRRGPLVWLSLTLLGGAFALAGLVLRLRAST